MANRMTSGNQKGMLNKMQVTSRMRFQGGIRGQIVVLDSTPPTREPGSKSEVRPNRLLAPCSGAVDDDGWFGVSSSNITRRASNSSWHPSLFHSWVSAAHFCLAIVG